ncbi:unnamed protein product [Mucor hiemalis]
MNSSNTHGNWFSIKNVASGKVISAVPSCASSPTDEYVRSKVLVVKQHYTDNELWCWEDNYLKNKFTGLVLDICKGKLRAIADTEICLYYKKPQEDSQNQRWAIRPAAGSESHTLSEHPLMSRRSSSQKHTGNVIYSVCNDGWVLDVVYSAIDSPNSQEKLVLFPQHEISSNNQGWEIIPETCMHERHDALTEMPPLTFDDNLFDSSIVNENSIGYSSSSSCTSLESIGFAHGLSPAKRSSQSSVVSSRRKSSLGEDYQTLQASTLYP